MPNKQIIIWNSSIVAMKMKGLEIVFVHSTVFFVFFFCCAVFVHRSIMLKQDSLRFANFHFAIYFVSEINHNCFGRLCRKFLKLVALICPNERNLFHSCIKYNGRDRTKRIKFTDEFISIIKPHFHSFHEEIKTSARRIAIAEIYVVFENATKIELKFVSLSPRWIDSCTISGESDWTKEIKYENDIVFVVVVIAVVVILSFKCFSNWLWCDAPRTFQKWAFPLRSVDRSCASCQFFVLLFRHRP